MPFPLAYSTGNPAGRTGTRDSDVAALRPVRRQHRHVLPGFGLSLGYTLVYLCLIVLIPLSAVFIKTARLTCRNSSQWSPRRVWWRVTG